VLHFPGFLLSRTLWNKSDSFDYAIVG